LTEQAPNRAALAEFGARFERAYWQQAYFAVLVGRFCALLQQSRQTLQRSRLLLTTLTSPASAGERIPPHGSCAYVTHARTKRGRHLAVKRWGVARRR
jgi:hypothetical protein